VCLDEPEHHHGDTPTADSPSSPFSSARSGSSRDFYSDFVTCCGRFVPSDLRPALIENRAHLEQIANQTLRAGVPDIRLTDDRRGVLEKKVLARPPRPFWLPRIARLGDPVLHDLFAAGSVEVARYCTTSPCSRRIPCSSNLFSPASDEHRQTQLGIAKSCPDVLLGSEDRRRVP